MFKNILTKETTTVKAKTGLVEYTRTKYIQKQGSLEGYPQLKKILENKAISELIYR